MVDVERSQATPHEGRKEESHNLWVDLCPQDPTLGSVLISLWWVQMVKQGKEQEGFGKG